MDRLAFSTLGCPDWSLDQIVRCAGDNGYSGLEFRGLLGEMDMTRVPDFMPSRLPETRRKLHDEGLKIVNLGSSAKMHFAESDTRQANLDEGKRYIDLAQELDCPFIRVFPDDLPANQPVEKTLDLISSGLRYLASYASGTGVTVLLESHGKVVYRDMLLKIMQDADHPGTGLIWDYFNMWIVTKEAPSAVFATLQAYIRHIHLKDASLTTGKPAYCLLGEGVGPLAEVMSALKAGGYEGYLSFEWEKRWHPEILGPEIAFPHFARAIRKYR